MSAPGDSLLVKLTPDELLRITRTALDELGIPYELRPGGFNQALRLDPADITRDPDA